MTDDRPFRCSAPAACVAAVIAAAAMVLVGGDAAAQALGPAGTGDLPPNYNPNACYARVFIPPRVEARPNEVVVQDAYDVIRIEQPTYRLVEREIVVRPAYERLEYEPPVFETRVQEVVIEPEKIVYEVVPAKFADEEQAVLIRERYETWDASCGRVSTPIAGATGEVLCRKVVPPHYKKIGRRVLVEQARVVQKRIPPKTKPIKIEVEVRPKQERRVQVPAKTVTIAVQELATPFRELRDRIPAETANIPVEVKVQEGRIEWREVLCDSNLTDRDLVRSVQRALRQRGFNAGPIDGVVGRRTRAALASFQEAQGLPQSGFTLETLSALGLRR